MAKLTVSITFVPIVFGWKEKLLAKKFFRDNSKIRNILNSNIKTDEDKLSGIRKEWRDQMEIKIQTGLFKLKNKGDVENFEMLTSDKEREILFNMIGNDEIVSKWERTWKNQTSIFDPRGIGLKFMGVKVSTERC